MTKTSVSQWSTTAADNTDVGGVNLQDNTMRPSDVNNAIREIMAQVKSAALVSGPLLTADNTLPRFDGTAGAVQTSGIVVNDANDMSNVSSLATTGNVTVANSSNFPTINIRKTSSTGEAYLIGQTGTSTRWIVRLGDSTAESGANAGSDWSVAAHDDSGAFLHIVLQAKRSTGLLSLPKGQLQFPATQNPSSDANVLDDYEEGNWTPRMSFNGSETGVTYSTQAGQYTKIGRQVHFYGQITLTNNGSGVGAARILGLPFSASGFSIGEFTINFYNNLSAGTGLIGLIGNTSATAVDLFIPGATATAVASDTNITNTAVLIFGGTYNV